MNTIIDLCFLCTKDYNCVPVDNKIVSQVEYVLPEITIFKLGVPLRICSACDGALCAFSKFKHSSLESSRRLEASINGAQSRSLHTSSPPVVQNVSLTGQQMAQTSLHTDETFPLEVFIKEEKIEEPQQEQEYYNTEENISELECTINNSEGPSSDVNKSKQLYEQSSQEPSTNLQKIEEIFIKEEKIDESFQDTPYFNNIQDNELIAEYTTNNQSEHRCNICSELFINKTILAHHIKKNHRRIKDLPCTVCKKIFIHEYDLKKHMELHFGLKNFHCPVCKKRFSNKNNYKQHIKHHTEKEIRCETCNEICTPETYLKNHIAHAGIQIKDPFPCSICKRLFRYKSELDQHMKLHIGVKDFKCETCNKSFTLKNDLVRHLKIHAGIKEFQCKICNKFYTRKFHLETHMKIHSGIKEFKCDVCGKYFLQKSALVKHINSHSNLKNCSVIRKKTHEVKDFECELCNMSFTKRRSFLVHMKTHSKVLLKDIQCEICNKLFTQKSSLIIHMKTHSGEKDYECEICHNSFTQKSSLVVHMKAHAGVKDYHCEICNKSFTRNFDLTRHMNSHYGIKDFHCDICGKSFGRKNNLNTHMKIHAKRGVGMNLPN